MTSRVIGAFEAKTRLSEAPRPRRQRPGVRDHEARAPHRRAASPCARRAIEESNGQWWLSAASVWELAIKSSLGRVTLPAPVDECIAQRVQQGLQVLSVDWTHAAAVERLPFLATVLLQKGQLAAALSAATRAVELNPSDPVNQQILQQVRDAVREAATEMEPQTPWYKRLFR